MEHVHRRVVRADRHRLLVDDAPGIGLLDHLVQRHAGLALALEDRPIERRAPAVLGQERAVHVERAEPRVPQQRHRQHAAVVEGEDQVGLRLRHRALEHCGVGVREHAQLFLRGKIEQARVPAALVRVVLVRDDERHLETGLEERGEAADAYVPVAEDDRLASQEESFSSTAWMR